ncbi:DUF2797 domain-containing protein [Candidatus Micrarchaeota archaeon]|nr:DUF2797 domain-containing protein [Candidatus Micrarchaeota archaeon]
MHLISFYSHEKPNLVYWSEDEHKEMSLGGEVCFSFSDKKRCTGYKTAEKRHPCFLSSEGIHQCGFCRSRDISKVYTRRDFRGYEEMAEELASTPYSVYLASFGDIVKCGVTQSKRIQKRLREQGADYWTEIMRLEGMDDAYEMESLLQRTFGFRNAVWAKTKLKMLGIDGKNNIYDAIQKVKEEKIFSSYIHSTDINKIKYKIPKNPILTSAVNGKILDGKASLLFFSNDSETYVVDMKKHYGKEFSFI